MDSLGDEIENMKLLIESKAVSINVRDEEIKSLRSANNAILLKFSEYVENEKKVKTRSWVNGLWQGVLSGSFFILLLMVI